MRPLSGNDIRGNWATLLLPIDKDNSINMALLEEEIKLLISMRVDGIYSNGTAGEFYNQTEDEFDAVSMLLAEMCDKSGVAFQIGCSHENPLMSLQRILRAKALKPGAIQVILPDWIACDLDECISFFDKISYATDEIPVVIYNPGHSRTRLDAEAFRRLKQMNKMLVGCKVPWTDRESIKSVNHAVRDFSVFVPGHYLATGFKWGAHGAYSNVACIHPAAAQVWYNKMSTDLAGALELEHRIQLFMKRFIAPYITDHGYSNTAADKFLAALGGWSGISTRVRWPYKSIPQTDVARVRQEAIEILPEFFTGSMP